LPKYLTCAVNIQTESKLYFLGRLHVWHTLSTLSILIWKKALNTFWHVQRSHNKTDIMRHEETMKHTKAVLREFNVFFQSSLKNTQMYNTNLLTQLYLEIFAFQMGNAFNRSSLPNRDKMFFWLLGYVLSDILELFWFD
jgi:hypothetical protein